MNTGEFWAAFVLAVLSGGLIREVISAINNKIKGRTARRSELEEAWAKADTESQRRRIAEDYAFTIRKLLLESPCVEAHQVPAFPPYEKEKKL